MPIYYTLICIVSGGSICAVRAFGLHTHYVDVAFIFVCTARACETAGSERDNVHLIYTAGLLIWLSIFGHIHRKLTETAPQAECN